MAENKYNTRDFGNIYRFIYRNQNCSRLSIAKSLHISRPHCYSQSELLQESGLVYTDSTLESTGGRKPSVFRCTPDARFFHRHRHHAEPSVPSS